MMTFTELLNLMETDAMPDPDVINEYGEAIGDITSNGVVVLTAKEFNDLADGGDLYDEAEAKAKAFIGERMYSLCETRGLVLEAILAAAELF